MSERPALLLSRYVLALSATAAAVLLRWLLGPWTGDAVPLVTLYGAVAFAVWRCGYGPAIGATIAGYLACNVLFIEPQGRVTMNGPGELLGLVLYLVTCAIIIGFGAATQGARRRAVESREALRASESRLAVELAAVKRMQQVSARLVQASGLPELLHEILEAAIEITGAEMGNIQLVQDGALRIVTQRGFEAPFLQHFDGVHEGRATCGTAMVSGRRVVVEDIRKSSLFAGTPELPVLTAAGVRAVQSTPLIGPTGRLLGMFSTHYRQPHRPTETELQHVDVLARLAGDLIDRAQGEVALRESEERFRAMADAAPVMIWLSGTDSLCTWFNQRWLEFVGRTLEQELGDGWAENVRPEDLERCLSTYTAAFEARRPFSMEYRLRRHDGEWRWVLDNGVPRTGPDSKFAGFIGSCIDITERKEWERGLQETDRRKDEFLAMLAHELRNPLAPIRNGARLLLAHDSLEPEVRRCTEVIERQVSQMARLIDDLLDVTRITQRRLELRRARIDLASVIGAAVETSGPAIERGGHELTVSLPEETVVLDADAVRLAQVFSNLLNNAANYTEARGHIRLVCGRRGDEVLVTVTDDGVGIAPEQLARVFDMFSPAASTAAHAPAGLGIGLSLARLLVELHGGRIEARSEGRGRGAEFTVRLPVAAEAAAGPAPEAAEPAPAVRGKRATKVRRVLVADDLEDSADTLAMLVRSMGHEVRTAYDGEQAVAAAAEFEPDLVLLDIGMPKLNGYEACRRIRARSNGRGPVLVALTGWDQERHRRRSEAAGFDRHLIKPVDPTLLARLLDTLEAPAAAAG